MTTPQLLLLVWLAATALFVLGVGALRLPTALKQVRMGAMLTAAPLGAALSLHTHQLGGSLPAVASVGALAVPVAMLVFGIVRWRAPTPSARSLVAQLADTGSLFIGLDHGPSGEAFNPAPVVIPPSGQFGNIHIVGAIGAGKTAALIKPILEQIFAQRSSSPSGKPGGVVLDIKGGMAAAVRALARTHGREADVYVLRPGGEHTYNVLGTAAPEVEAARLFDALFARDDGRQHPYYRDVAKRFLHAAIDGLDEHLGRGAYTLRELTRMINEPEYFAHVTAESRRRSVIDLQRSLDDLRPRERQQLTSGLQAILSLWMSEQFAATFAPRRPGTFPGFAALIERGAFVVIELPEDQFNAELCRSVGLFLLSICMDTVLRRTNPEVEINRERPFYLIADEAHVIISERLARFTAVSRQSRTCVVLAHQSVGQIHPSFRATILANLRTQIVLAVNDTETAEHFAQAFGTVMATRKTESESRGRGLHARSSSGTSETEVEQPRFRAIELVELPQWQAVGAIFDGQRKLEPRRLEALPHFSWR